MHASNPSKSSFPMSNNKIFHSSKILCAVIERALQTSFMGTYAREEKFYGKTLGDPHIINKLTTNNGGGIHMRHYEQVHP